MVLVRIINMAYGTLFIATPKVLLETAECHYSQGLL